MPSTWNLSANSRTRTSKRLGVLALGHRKKLLKAISELNGTGSLGATRQDVSGAQCACPEKCFDFTRIPVYKPSRRSLSSVVRLVHAAAFAVLADLLQHCLEVPALPGHKPSIQLY